MHPNIYKFRDNYNVFGAINFCKLNPFSLRIARNAKIIAIIGRELVEKIVNIRSN